MRLSAVPPLPGGCPWSDWARPNVKWCEDNLCAWVTAPANTWSNLPYIIFAVQMWREAGPSRPTLRLFAPASALVGLTSGLYHASYTWVFQIFDFVGMFFFCCVTIALNARRMNVIGAGSVYSSYFAGVAACTLCFFLVPLLGLPVQLLVLFLVLTTLAQEMVLHHSLYRKHSHLRPNMRHFAAGILLLVVAFGCSLSDLLRVWCSPQNHVMNGHSLWHILTAVVLYLLFRFHSQFAYDGGGGDGGSGAEGRQRGGGLLPLRAVAV